MKGKTTEARRRGGKTGEGSGQDLQKGKTTETQRHGGKTNGKKPQIAQRDADLEKDKNNLRESAKSAVESPLIQFRPYQFEPFANRTNGIEVWCWSRQIGKSFTLAAWAVDRLLTRPGRLVTILSNSKDNGIELNAKVAEVCALLGQAYEQLDLSEDARFESMKLETYIFVNGKKGRIKVLAASPRTARGFSGDLILDEFAFHENSQAIWEAAEPIISSNPDFLCRIASTPNGKHNMFYRLCHDPSVVLRKIPRSLAWRDGLKIYHPRTRQPITPDQARALALDKRGYDQNYECIFADENMALLTYELIGQAERAGVGFVCAGDWSAEALERLRAAIGELYVGVDVGRQRDLTVITVLEKVEGVLRLRAQLALEGMKLPEQQRLLESALRMPKFRRCCIDMTGLGLGLFEYTELKWGSRVRGINFGTSVPATQRLQAEGRKAATVRVTEAMATELLGAFHDRRIEIPVDAELREDLRKPERIVTPGGRVSIAATRDEAGHADRFWSVALAVEASASGGGPFAWSGAEGGTADFTEGADLDGEGLRIRRGGGLLV